MDIRIEAIDKAARVYKPMLVKKGNQIAVLMKLRKPIDVFLVDGQTMRTLNRKYRKKDKTTNVLSFVTPPDFPIDVLGEIYLDPKYIEKKNEDLAFMLLHGVLHILGYDHERKSDRIVMEKKEKQVMKKLK
jgi:probable rRNA maturation factor